MFRFVRGLLGSPRRAVPPYAHGGGFDNLGVGVADQALVDYPAPLPPNYYDDRYHIRESFEPLSSANFEAQNTATLTDLVANGFFLHGTFAMQALREPNSGGING